jgi:phosphoglycolate phosphatase
MVKLCVFDCDGTLVDTQHTIVATMHAAFDAHRLTRPEASAVRRLVGLPLLEVVARLIPEADAGTHEAVTASYRDAFIALRRDGAIVEPMFPGVVDCLERLGAAGWLLGVATGKGHRGLIGTLGGHGIEDRFVTLQTADRGPGKPNPDMLLRAMNETGAEAARTVMVGDTTFDVAMARNAGAVAVGVAWGYHEVDELEAAGAHHVVDAFAQVPAVVEDLVGAP